MANLTIRGLDAELQRRLREEAIRRNISIEETARLILTGALAEPKQEPAGVGSQIHRYFEEAGEFDLEIPPRSLPRSASGA